MGNELIRLCHGIECYGLVNYQYGVWEEQITIGVCDSLSLKAPVTITVTAGLGDCLDLYEAPEANHSSGGAWIASKPEEILVYPLA